MTVSAIIPTWNEAAHLPRLLAALQAMDEAPPIIVCDIIVCDVIVCDGGSTDATIEIARQNGALVVSAPRNRGLQLNAGARHATGEILWFLHADARPHPNSARRIVGAVQAKNARPPILGGNFRLQFDSDTRAARTFEIIARVQRRLGVYYGDSGLWVRRDVWQKLGGFRPLPLFEDYDFARRLEGLARRSGNRTLCLDVPLIVSARRFEKHPLRALALWLGLQVLFSLGVSPHLLARWYHGARR